MKLASVKAAAQRMAEVDFVAKYAGFFLLIYGDPKGTQIGFDTLIAEKGHAAPATPALPRSIHVLRKERLREDLDALSIGRASGCDIVLDSDRISKLHARLKQIEGEWQLQDLKSANGTFVNGSRLETLVLTRINDGDYVQFGDVEARVMSAARMWRYLRG